MIALKNLVIGIANNFQIMINKTFMYGSGNWGKINFSIKVSENSM